LASIEKKRESGALDAAAAARAIREAATSWGAAPRSVVVAAIDLSTHEFALVAPAWEAAFGARCGYLSELAVHPAFQRLGLGAMLFNAAVVAARARDFSDSFLHVEERNTGARAIYEAEGFVLVPPCKAQEEFDAALVLDQGPKQVLYRLSV
jgi:ribosomal protein S18 acetylase RimI-like enzyme